MLIDVVGMPFVINAIKKLLWSVETMSQAEFIISFWNHVYVRNIMWLVNTPSKHETLTQYWSNAGPPSGALAQHQTSTGSTPRVCWAACNISWSGIVLTAGGNYKPTPTQCLLNVGTALPVLASIHIALVGTSCWRYWHDALSQSWVNVGPPSVTLAHIQRGAEHGNPILG